MIEKRLLGTTGVEVSVLGLGTVKFGRNQGVKYPTAFTLPDDKTLTRLLSTARDLGINLLDTAPAYGESEQRLGKLLKSQRQEWFVVTKVGEEFENGESYFDFSGKHIRKSVERSLKRLNTDYIDSVLVHSDGNDRALAEHQELLPALISLKQRGLIRSIGFSGKDVAGSALVMPHVDVMMITLNKADNSQVALIEMCKRESKGVLIKKALASGHANDPAEALTFVLDTPGVTCAIVGTINQSHLIENVRSITAS